MPQPKMNRPNEVSVCEWYDAAECEPKAGAKLGVALSTIGELPINGLRLLERGETNGWYIWCGSEMSKSTDFFAPLHVEHVADYLPLVRNYLSLPPGYRFQIDDAGYEDVWFDENLLNA